MKNMAIILVLLGFATFALIRVASKADDHMETMNDFKEEK